MSDERCFHLEELRKGLDIALFLERVFFHYEVLVYSKTFPIVGTGQSVLRGSSFKMNYFLLSE